MTAAPGWAGPLARRLADFALIAGFFTLAFVLGIFPNRNTDYWWHLRTGDLIRQTGRVPEVDVYTFMAEGRPWIDLHWTFQVLLSLGHETFGIRGLILAKCAVTASALLLLITARRREWPVWVMVLAWLPALLVLSGRNYLRPETLTLLYLAGFLAILSRWERRPALAWLLPLIQLLWVNVQGLFIFGPFLIGLALFDAALRPGSLRSERRGWWLQVGSSSLLAVLACLINPYGLTGTLYPLELLGTLNTPVFSREIAELQSIPTFLEARGFDTPNGPGGLLEVLTEDPGYLLRYSGFLVARFPEFPLPLQLHLVTLALGALSMIVPTAWLLARGVESLVRGRSPSKATPDADGDGRRSRERPNARSSERTKSTKAKTKRKAKENPKGSATTSKAKPSGRSSTRTERSSESDGATWRFSIFRLVLLIGFGYLSLQATRNSHQFAAVFGAVTAWSFGEWVAALNARGAGRAVDGGDTPGAGIVEAVGRLLAFTALGVTFGLVVSGLYYRISDQGRTIGLGHERLWHAEGAVEAAGRPGMPDRALVFHLGHAALYEYQHGPERKVYADARLEVIGPEIYLSYRALQEEIASNRPGWTSRLDDLQRPAVLVDNRPEFQEISASLLRHRDWRCVHYDPVALLFVHRAYVGAVRAYEVDFLRLFLADDPGTLGLRDASTLEASARTLYGLGAMMASRQANSSQIRPLLLLGRAHAGRAGRQDPEAIGPLKLLGQFSLLDDPTGAVGQSGRYRRPFDPAFDLSVVRATYQFREAWQRDRDDFLSLFSLANLYQARGMNAAELEVRRILAELVPINPSQARFIAESVQRVRELEGFLEESPPTDWSNRAELDERVELLLDQGRVELAAEVLEEAYRETPPPWSEIDRLAVLRLHLGDPEAARETWLRPDAGDPPRPALRETRVAHTELIQGRLDRARAGFEAALDLEPDLFEAQYGLMQVAVEAGDPEQAVASALRAREILQRDGESDPIARRVVNGVLELFGSNR